MAKAKTNSPLLGYNTNIRHAGHLFHIQTEDSGIDHPHIITHLFTEGTILASKKTAYDEYLNDDHWEERVRQLMKDQHKSMFVELRDGQHDEIAEKILGRSLNHSAKTTAAAPPNESFRKTGGFSVQGNDIKQAVATMAPAKMDSVTAAPRTSDNTSGRSIFESPDAGGSFGESLISDKSLDEVILNYLADELDD